MTPPTPTLKHVTDRFDAEVAQLESIFARCRGDRTVTGYRLPYIPTEEGCLFGLWDAWNRCMRELAISSCQPAVMGLSGVIYAHPAPLSEAQVLAHLFANRRGRNFRIINNEPRWYDPACLADIANSLQLPNERQIVSAVTATSVSLGGFIVPVPLEEIRTARNFAAHKNPSTQQDLAAYSSRAFAGLSDHMRALRSGVESFSEWAQSLTSIASVAAQ